MMRTSLLLALAHTKATILAGEPTTTRWYNNTLRKPRPRLPELPSAALSLPWTFSCMVLGNQGRSWMVFQNEQCSLGFSQCSSPTPAQARLEVWEILARLCTQPASKNSNSIGKASLALEQDCRKTFTITAISVVSTSYVLPMCFLHLTSLSSHQPSIQKSYWSIFELYLELVIRR